MKVTKAITIDPEIWVKAQQRTDSVSGIINFLLRRWIETESEEYERNKIETMKLKMQEQQIEMSVLHKEIEDMKKKQDKSRIIRVIE